MYFSNSGQNSGQNSKGSMRNRKKVFIWNCMIQQEACKRRMSQTNHFSSVSLHKGKQKKTRKANGYAGLWQGPDLN